VSAPFTGALADRFGCADPRVGGVALTALSVGYAALPDYRLMLGLTVVHGLFWSGVLTASAAYMIGILPPSRRAEGIAYWDSRPCSRWPWDRPSGFGSITSAGSRCAS